MGMVFKKYTMPGLRAKWSGLPATLTFEQSYLVGWHLLLTSAKMALLEAAQELPLMNQASALSEPLGVLFPYE